MYRSCSFGVRCWIFNLTCCSQNNMPASGRSSTTATAKLLTCTLLKFSALNHMTVTLITSGLNPTCGFEARQYRHETLLPANVFLENSHRLTKARHEQSHLCALDRI